MKIRQFSGDTQCTVCNGVNFDNPAFRDCLRVEAIYEVEINRYAHRLCVNCMRRLNTALTQKLAKHEEEGGEVVKYSVLMLKDIEQTRMKRFMGYRWNMQHGGVDLSEYDTVYTGSIKPRAWNGETLEAIYTLFNTTRIEGYFGRSMSVSDIIVLDGVGTFFCDSVGFVNIREGSDG